MEVLIILGHPRIDSFCGALAMAYQRGAQEAGCNVTLLKLADLSFNPDVVLVHPQHQEMEDDLIGAQQLIRNADHLCFVYPTWWGSTPALLKGFIDRVFTPGFAFYELNYGSYFPLLKGKTAQVLTTMDTPELLYRTLFRAPGKNALKRSTLQLCGVRPVRVKYFTPLNYSEEKTHEAWIGEAEELGYKLKKGFLTPVDHFFRKATPWIKALRLQFYLLTFIAYWVGALLASQLTVHFNFLIFILGYAIIFCIEAATVFTNEYYDYKTDEQNTAFSPFSGGSRVLINQDLSKAQLTKGIFRFLIIALVLIIAFVLINPGNNIASIAIIVSAAILGLGYTAPPLKFSYRTLGEPVVGITHSFAVLLAGFVFQGGYIGNYLPWLLSVPLFLSILPAIILSGIPDYFADKAVNKKTLAVRIGRDGAAMVAIGIIAFAIIVPIFLYHTYLRDYLSWMVYLPVIHGVYLIYLIQNYIGKKIKPERIDKIMIFGLLLMLWYGLIPLGVLLF